MKFEVGKYYKDGDRKMKCLELDRPRYPSAPILMMNMESGWVQPYPEGIVLEEWKEPIRLVQYINIYKDSIWAHDTRAQADSASSSKRIGCQRIEFVEGTWDE